MVRHKQYSPPRRARRPGPIHALLYRAALALLAGLAGLTGCQHANPMSSSVVVQDEGDQRPTVDNHEAAALQVAIGRALEEQGANDQAAAACREAIRRDPACGAAYLRLAVVCDAQGKCQEAEQHYAEALALLPGNPDVYCDHGYHLYLCHRYAEAEMNLRQAVLVAPGLVRAHNNLGMLLARTGHLDDALAEFRQGKCSPADANLNVALALTLEGDVDQAYAYYNRALAANPSCEAARAGLRELAALAEARSAQPDAPPTGPLQLAGVKTPGSLPDSAEPSQ
jgi:Tfp pilus assembly protein PilF